MCGIAGYIAKKENVAEAQDKFNNILISAEVRGTDACGVAFIEKKNRFHYAKAPKRASEFTQEQMYIDLLEEYEPRILIGHNRAKTQGDQANNMNNHPIVTKTGLAMIHNGIIYQEDKLFDEFNLQRDAEVDSEIIVRMIEHYKYAKEKDTIKAIQLASKKISGSMAIALLNDKEPSTLYLVARGNPVNFAYHIPTGIVYFASTESILRNGLVEYDSYFNSYFWRARKKSDYIFKQMEDKTGLKLTFKGWEEFEVEEPSSTVYASNKYYVSSGGGSTYKSKKKNRTTTNKSGRPIAVEGNGKEAINRALMDYKDFDIFERIQKPSNYLSELLIYRLEYIQELFASGDYFYLVQDDTGEEMVQLRNEVERIIHTLEARKDRTNRSDIIVPEFNDIWLITNDAYKDKVSKGEYINDINWILYDENRELYDRLDKAGLVDGGIGGYAWEQYEQGIFPHDEEEDGREKKSDKRLGGEFAEDYYCPACKSLKDRDICTDCGTINLQTVDDVLDEYQKRKEKEERKKLPN